MTKVFFNFISSTLEQDILSFIQINFQIILNLY